METFFSAEKNFDVAFFLFLCQTPKWQRDNCSIQANPFSSRRVCDHFPFFFLSSTMFLPLLISCVKLKKTKNSVDGSVTRWMREIFPGRNLSDPAAFPSRKWRREPSVRLFIRANTCGSSWLMESRVHAGLRPHAVILLFIGGKKRNGRAHNPAFKTR